MIRQSQREKQNELYVGIGIPIYIGMKYVEVTIRPIKNYRHCSFLGGAYGVVRDNFYNK
jgi:hypothetical protein